MSFAKPIQSAYNPIANPNAKPQLFCVEVSVGEVSRTYTLLGTRPQVTRMASDKFRSDYMFAPSQQVRINLTTVNPVVGGKPAQRQALAFAAIAARS